MSKEVRPYTCIHNDTILSLSANCTPAEIKVFLYLSTLVNCKVIHPSNATIVRMSKVEIKAMKRAIKGLRDKGYITYISGSGVGHCNVYTIVEQYLFKTSKKNFEDQSFDLEAAWLEDLKWNITQS